MPVPRRRLSRRDFLLFLGAAGLGAGLGVRYYRQYGGSISTKGSVSRVIRSWPRSKEDEMVWAKVKGIAGKIYPREGVRTPDYAEVYLSGRDRSILHTHLKGTGHSSRDVLFFLECLKEYSNFRYSHVAGLNKNGDVMGYETLFATSRLIRNIRAKDSPTMKRLEDLAKRLSKPHTSIITFENDLSAIGVSIRRTPAKGFTFYGDRWYPK